MPAWQEHLAAGESFFRMQVDALDDEQLHQACLLPDWTRAHLITHVSRNADALVNLLEWARTGVETPMYRSMEQRAADISAGATRSAQDIRSDSLDASQRLALAVAGFPGEAWSATVRTASGRPIEAGEIPWIRVRELWVHAVDLGSTGRFEDLPGEVGDAVLDEALTLLAARNGCPSLRVVCSESGREWTLGEPAGSTPTAVEGSRPDLLRWALGRSSQHATAPTVASWPRLPRWL